ncbi:MAG: hypothetical protein FD174_3178 [Geobacteraceae bacterium]|nr:MAG: hypothetical protein FD174_3178 [Geobacteraceae bacterium]
MAIRVKSFGMEIRPLKTTQELKSLDDAVNDFIAGNGIKRVISVSDASTTDDKGETIGLVRVIAYEE